jgi:hypothetical protein
MVYLRTTELKRKWGKYLTQFPDLVLSRMESGIFMVKNCGEGMALILSDWESAKGNIEVSVLEPVRIEDFMEDSELKEAISWLKRQKKDLKLLTNEREELPPEKAKLLKHLTKKRFSVTLKLSSSII